MKRYALSGRCLAAFLLAVIGLCITPAAPAHAGDDDDHNGLVFLVLSLESTFDLPTLDDCDCDDCDCDEECYYECDCYYCDCDEETGSETIIIEIGKFIAGKEIPDTRFELKAFLDEINLPAEFESLADLHEFEFTIIGSFDTKSPNTVHMVTPDEGDPEEPIPLKVQEAFFLASPSLTEDIDSSFPTTVEIAQFIFDVAASTDDPEEPYFLGDQSEDGGEGPLTVQAIMNNIFQTDVTLDAPEDDVFAEAEGDLFPHDPGERLFEFDLAIDPDDGEITVNICLPVEIDIKPGNAKNVINYKSKGVVWVAILSTDNFDAVSEVDSDTVKLGGASVEKTSSQDVNNDGIDDLKLKVRVKDIGLTKDTVTVDLTGSTNAGMCIEGSDAVTIVPGKK